MNGEVLSTRIMKCEWRGIVYLDDEMCMERYCQLG